MNQRLFGRRENAARRWAPAALGLFSVSALILGGFVYLLSSAPETADTLLEPVMGVMIVLTMFLIIAQSLRDGGIVLAFGLATVPILGAAVATELLLWLGAVSFGIPPGERLETYGLLLVPAYVFGSMAYLFGAALTWQVRRAPDNWWVWIAGSKTPASEQTGSRFDAWLGSLGPVGFTLVVVTFMLIASLGTGLIGTVLGMDDDLSLARLAGSGVIWGLSAVGLIFLVQGERPERS